MLNLILMGPISHPSLSYFIPCLPLNFLSSISYCSMWFWVLRYILFMIMLFIVFVLFTIHDKIIMLIGT
jgi:hypothetical protein